MNIEGHKCDHKMMLEAAYTEKSEVKYLSHMTEEAILPVTAMERIHSQ
jgi:hypothetical protein